MKTYERTLEHNRQMSEILKGRKFTKEHCENISKSLRGNKKLLGNQNYKFRDEEKMKTSIKKAMQRPEIKKKLSDSMKKRWKNTKYRMNQIENFKGRLSTKKGETFEELYGIEKATIIKRKMMVSNLGKTYPSEVNKRKGRCGILNAMSRLEIKKRQIDAIRDHGKHWKGGISYEPYSIDFTKQLKKKIKKRDGFKCKICGYTKKLHVHHIDYNKMNSNDDNLITLCSSCHSKTNWKRNYWKNIILNIILNIINNTTSTVGGNGYE